MRTVQTIGEPARRPPDVDAVVVALKSRTVPRSRCGGAILTACRWLKRHGARQIYFKYCSTFDSTDAGNIGPVTDALLDELGTDFTIACPAFPENGRTIYLGHLFVGRELLSDSGMRDHPLTPMRDANLVRVLGRQSRYAVDLIPYSVVKKGAAAIGVALGRLRLNGARIAIVDSLEDADLEQLGAACADMALLTGGSGAAIGLPQNFRRSGLLPARAQVPVLEKVDGPGAVLSGSCSAATLAQVDAMKALHPSRKIDPGRIAADPVAAVTEIVAWAKEMRAASPLLIYSSAAPEEVAATQARLGGGQAGSMIEQALAEIAKKLVESGVRRLVVAGGETSGAVVSALGIDALEIGPQIEPGVPATLSLDNAARCLGAEVRQFRQPRLLHESSGGTAMNERRAHYSITQLCRSMFERKLTFGSFETGLERRLLSREILPGIALVLVLHRLELWHGTPLSRHSCR